MRWDGAEEVALVIVILFWSDFRGALPQGLHNARVK
jgi:hypothetical protein